jgi:hypothetical protein
MLAERWNGTEWSIKTTPNPTGATASELKGVSCASSEACTAVGNYHNSTGAMVTLAERWNGTAWSVQTTPNPTGATSISLAGVSCVSSVCAAVGSYTNSTGTVVTLVEWWNGTEWSIPSTPNPTGAKSSTLSGVSCTAVLACTATGSYVNSSGTELTLVERFASLKWSIQESPNPTGAHGSGLEGVSCGATEACVAVGGYTSGPVGANVHKTLAEGWNGTAWAIQETPRPKIEATGSFGGVSCTSATACTAVGRYRNSSNLYVTLAERWNGTAWLIQSTPNPSEAPGSVLNGVSCSSSEACIAVGSYGLGSGGTYKSLAERWDGKEWSIVATVNPPEDLDLSLAGVSCTSAEACTAVGYFVVGSSFKPLAERWNGTVWAIQETPSPTEGTSISLSGVSCTAAEACVAVGKYVNSAGHVVTLAERRSGTEWAVQTTPNPTGSTSSSLSGVSCTSTTACTAVGSANIEGKEFPALVERWNGTAWAIQETPSPKEGKESSLSGVSCTSAEACSAVGSHSGLSLVEQWNGKAWAIEEAPNPTGATNIGLSGVSCTSSGFCVAAGHYVNSAGSETVLVEEG